MKKDREIWFCAISFFLLIINDFTLNNSFAFSHHGLNAAVPAAIEIIWGAILYKNKDCFLKRKYPIIYGTVLFIVLNIIRMLIVLNHCCWRDYLPLVLGSGYQYTEKVWYYYVAVILSSLVVYFLSRGVRLIIKKVHI